jgi:hypothetical protein
MSGFRISPARRERSSEWRTCSPCACGEDEVSGSMPASRSTTSTHTPTSHAAVSGLDPFEAVRRLGDRLVHVHLSNNAGRGWDSHLPLDQGVLPIREFLDLLGAEGFSGNVSLELDLRRYLEDDDALRRVLASNLAICRERLPQPV